MVLLAASIRLSESSQAAVCLQALVYDRIGMRQVATLATVLLA